MSIPFSIRNEVFRLDDFTCVYCGYRGNDVVPDHYVPSSRGGPDIIDNLYTSCVSCNTKKRDKPIHVIGMSLQYGRFSYMRKEIEVTGPPTKISFYNDHEVLLSRFPRPIAAAWLRVVQTLNHQANSHTPRGRVWDYWNQECDIVPTMDRLIPGAFEELNRHSTNDFFLDQNLIVELERIASFVYLGGSCTVGERIQSTDDWRSLETERW